MSLEKGETRSHGSLLGKKDMKEKLEARGNVSFRLVGLCFCFLVAMYLLLR